MNLRNSPLLMYQMIIKVNIVWKKWLEVQVLQLAGHSIPMQIYTSLALRHTALEWTESVHMLGLYLDVESGRSFGRRLPWCLQPCLSHRRPFGYEGTWLLMTAVRNFALIWSLLTSSSVSLISRSDVEHLHYWWEYMFFHLRLSEYLSLNDMQSVV